MYLKTIKEFHWLTKIVIALTGLLMGLLLIAMVMELIFMPNPANSSSFTVSQGLNGMILPLAFILPQVFFVVLLIIAISMVISRIKFWIEGYLDAVLLKLDTLATQKTGFTDTELTVISGKIDGIEKKLENIEHILEKVAE
jgi:cobalamin biosynthesis protein CobD/CbiB